MPEKCDDHTERLIKLEYANEGMVRHISELKQTAYANRERLIALCGQDGKNGAVGALRIKMAKIEETADKLEDWLQNVRESRAADRVRIGLLIGAVSFVGAGVGTAIIQSILGG